MFRHLLVVYLFFAGIDLYAQEQFVNISKDMKYNKRIIYKKQEILRTLEKMLKSNKGILPKGEDINKLIQDIRSTSAVLKNILSSKTYTKEQLQKEIDGFNKNMKRIEELYKGLINTQNNKTIETQNKKQETKQLKLAKDGKEVRFSPVKNVGQSIVSLDWNKKVRSNNQHNPMLQNDRNTQESSDLIDLTSDDLTDQLTMENVEEYIATKNSIDSRNTFERKEFPDDSISGIPNSSEQVHSTNKRRILNTN